MSATAARPGRSMFAGLFIVTLTTLMHEVLLTRIFSVTMWYHFAFMAISIAMFGMTFGALIVYLKPQWFPPQRLQRHLAVTALLFAVSVVFSFLGHLCIPFVVHKSLTGVFVIAFTYTLISVPFVFSGICVCLALTSYPFSFGRLYAADLTGAAFGCIASLLILRYTDGPTAVIAVGTLGALGAYAFSAGSPFRKVRLACAACMAGLFAFALVNGIFAARQRPLIRFIWAKEEMEPRPLYQRWNSFSRIAVDDRPLLPIKPFGWGISTTYSGNTDLKELNMRIDATAGTILQEYDGKPSRLEHLRHDITNMAHYLRADSNVLVVGVGGGRDVLSALAFNQKSVVGVEINNVILDTLNKYYGDLTGHLDRHPGIRFVNDEARSHIAGSRDRYDILQISLVDTWAATAAGAFVLTENSLYTVEAWRIFLQHLTDRGILSVSRWYFKNRPGEIYRLASLARTALVESGISDPRAHVIIVRKMLRYYGKEWPDGVGTMLVSREPFTPQDCETVTSVAGRMRFDVVLTPRESSDPFLANIMQGEPLRELETSLSLKLSPPRDDSPFFFNMLRPRDILSRKAFEHGFMSFNLKAVFVLSALMLTVVLLNLLCIVVPLTVRSGGVPPATSFPLLCFFTSIGLGFMLVEISQMQRLIVFLGHPTYGLSVVLFTLLLAGGLGSYAVERLSRGERSFRDAVVYLLLLAVVAAIGKATPAVLSAYQSAGTMTRILVSLATIAPLGFLMGTACPTGIRFARSEAVGILPWLWGLNGAASVCASVIAVGIALNLGISTSYWTGFGCYVAGGLSLMAAAVWGRQKADSDPAGD